MHHDIQPDPTPDEACAMIGCSKPTLYKLLARDELDSYTLGRSRRITIASLLRKMKREPEAA
jgi:excisionase family DNA binding protein